MKVGELWAELSLRDRNFTRGLTGAKSQISGIGKSMTATGAAMTATGRTLNRRVTLPIVGAGVAVLKMGGDYQKSMNMVRAVTGATGTDMQRLEDTAKFLGRTTQFSAAQAADGMYFLASAGFDTNQVIAAMPGVLQLAAAAQMDLATAADITTNILSGYGMEVSELGRVNDVLVRTFQLTNTNLQQLGEAMKYVGPVAQGAGVEFEQTAAAIGLMGNAGIQGSQAGTSLRGAITRLLNPTAEASRILNRLGVEAVDSAGNLLPLDQIIAQLEQSGASTADMMSIFGQRAGPAMMALVEQGSGALRDMTQELRDSGGIAERVANVQMEGLNGSMARLKSAVEGAAIAIAESGFMDFIADLADKAAGAAQRLAETNPELLRTGAIIAGSLAAAGPILLLVGGAFKALGTILAPGAAVAAALGPYGWVVAGLVALGGALVVAYRESEAFRDVVQGVARVVADAGSDMVAGLQQVASWWGDNADPMAREAHGFADKFNQGLGQISSFVRDTLLPGLGEGLKQITDYFGITRDDVAAEVEGMSNETVGTIVAMSQEVTDGLRVLARQGGVLSAELADGYVGNVERMRDDTVAAAEDQRTRTVDTAVALAQDLDTVSWEAASGVIRNANRQADESVQAVQEQSDGVIALLEHMRDEGGEVSEGQAAQIIAQMERARDESIAAVTSMDTEYRAVMGRLANESGKISVEMASQLIGDSARTRDETIAAADEEYRQRVASIQQLERDSSSFTSKMADEAIREAGRMRNDTVREANRQHSGVVGEVEGMRRGVVREVDVMTGTVHSTWTLHLNTMRDWNRRTSDRIADAWTGFWRGHVENTRTNLTNVRNNWNTWWSDTITNTSRNLANVRSNWNSWWGDTIRNTQSNLANMRTNWTGFWSGFRTWYSDAYSRFDAWTNRTRDNVLQAFRDMRSGIGTIWSGITSRIATPINWVIQNPYEKGIRALWNAIAGRIGATPLPAISAFNTGGRVPGAGLNEDSVPAVLTPGEYVLSRQAVKTIGVERIEAAHQMARQGRRTAGEYLFGGDQDNPGLAFQGFNEGGQVAAVQRWARNQAGKPYVWGGHGPGGYDCSGFVSAAVRLARGMSPVYARMFATGSFGPSRGAGGLQPGLKSAFGVGVSPNTGRGIGHMSATVGGLNIEATPPRVRVGSAARGATNSMYPWRFHLPQVGGRFVGGPGGEDGPDDQTVGLFRSAWNALKGLVTGSGSSDIASLVRGAVRNVGRQAIGWALEKIPFGSLIRRLIGFDAGGWLQPGMTAAINRTSGREAVMPETVMMDAIRDAFRDEEGRLLDVLQRVGSRTPQNEVRLARESERRMAQLVAAGGPREVHEHYSVDRVEFPNVTGAQQAEDVFQGLRRAARKRGGQRR